VAAVPIASQNQIKKKEDRKSIVRRIFVIRALYGTEIG
jgi:hypothetical protein